MKKIHLILGMFILSLAMMSCAGTEEKKEGTDVEVEMKIDEKELEEEFEKLDEDVKKMDTTENVK